MTIEANDFGPPHRVVEVAQWHDAVEGLRRDGLTYFDWLSAVDEHPDGFRVVLHVARPAPLEHLLLVTYLDREDPTIASVADVFAGAGWHERETHEMFGITFTSPVGEPVVLEPLLLPDGFEGHPLRKEFVLASRVVKAWPGAKEPGEGADSAHAPGRRRVKPPGVPDPHEWPSPDPRTSAPSAGGQTVQNSADLGGGPG